MSRKDAILSMRQLLVKRRDALRKALAGDLSLLKELRAQTSGDMVDAALDSVQDEISSQLAEVESRELTRIEYALERMRNGQFGICEGCGTNIPMARLNALPYATYCIKCQREAERQGAGGGRRRRLEPAPGRLPAATPTCRSTTSSWTFHEADGAVVGGQCRRRPRRRTATPRRRGRPAPGVRASMFHRNLCRRRLSLAGRGWPRPKPPSAVPDRRGAAREAGRVAADSRAERPRAGGPGHGPQDGGEADRPHGGPHRGRRAPQTAAKQSRPAHRGSRLRRDHPVEGQLLRADQPARLSQRPGRRHSDQSGRRPAASSAAGAGETRTPTSAYCPSRRPT